MAAAPAKTPALRNSRRCIDAKLWLFLASDCNSDPFQHCFQGRINLDAVKKLSLLVLALLCGSFLLQGCFPEGEGKNELIEPNQVMGAAGGETQDQTAPVAPAASSGGGETASAFPASVQPEMSANHEDAADDPPKSP
jgi:hypothetical protein